MKQHASKPALRSCTPTPWTQAIKSTTPSGSILVCNTLYVFSLAKPRSRSDQCDENHKIPTSKIHVTKGVFWGLSGGVCPGGFLGVSLGASWTSPGATGWYWASPWAWVSSSYNLPGFFLLSICRVAGGKCTFKMKLFR